MGHLLWKQHEQILSSFDSTKNLNKCCQTCLAMSFEPLISSQGHPNSSCKDFLGFFGLSAEMANFSSKVTTDFTIRANTKMLSFLF